MATSDGDRAEANRRLELSRYDCWFFGTTFALVNHLRGTLERIERCSQELLAKGTAAPFVGERADSEELVDELRETITHYQVSEIGLCWAQRDLCDRIDFSKRRSTNESQALVSAFSFPLYTDDQFIQHQVFL